MRGDGLTDREAAHRQAVEWAWRPSDVVGVGRSQRDVGAALHDAEESLRLAPWRRGSGEPSASSSRNGLFHDGARGVTGRADVELHGDVGAEEALHAHRFFGRERVARAVEVRSKDEAVFADAAPLGEREGLKSP